LTAVEASCPTAYGTKQTVTAAEIKFSIPGLECFRSGLLLVGAIAVWTLLGRCLNGTDELESAAQPCST